MFRNLIPAISVLLSSTSFAIAETPFGLEAIASLDRPWAMAVLPQGGFLVTERQGGLSMCPPRVPSRRLPVRRW